MGVHTVPGWAVPGEQERLSKALNKGKAPGQSWNSPSLGLLYIRFNWFYICCYCEHSVDN